MDVKEYLTRLKSVAIVVKAACAPFPGKPIGVLEYIDAYFEKHPDVHRTRLLEKKLEYQFYREKRKIK